MSVPIRDGKNGPILGLLVGGIDWENFETWLEGTVIPSGRLVVFNDRGQPLMRHKGDDAPLEVGSPKYASELARQLMTPDKGKPAYVETFNDPFPGGKPNQLAGYVLFDPNPEGTKGDDPLAGFWGVVVEQDKEQVLDPVVRLRERVFFAGTMVLVGAVVLTGGVWWFLIRLLRRQERLGNG